jgi:hypothetical protein
LDARRIIKLFITLTPLAFYSELGWADAFQQSGSVGISAEYDSNPVMATVYPSSIWRSLLDPSYSLKKTNGGYELNGGAALHVARSSNQRLSQNRNDPSMFIDLKNQIKSGQIAMTARYDEISTRISEIDITGPNTVDSTRASRTISGNLNEEISERSTFSMNGAYSDVIYKGGGYMDYISRSGNPMFSYALSEYNSIFFNASYADTQSAMTNSRLANALLGWNWKASDDLDGTLQVGRFKLTGANLANQGTAQVKFTGQQSGLVLYAGREVTPSGQGSFVVVNRAKGNWSYVLSDSSKGGVDLEWRKTWLAYDIFNRTAGAWLQHQLNSLWVMRTYYTYRASDQVGVGNASSNLLGISFVYKQSDF